MKANKEVVLAHICYKINERTTFTDCYKQISAKFPMSERSFADYWKEGQKRQKELNVVLKDEFVNHTTEEQKKRWEKGNFTQEEIVGVMQEIMLQAQRDADRINAARLICEILGYKAPVRSEIDITEKTPIFLENYLVNMLTQPPPTITIEGRTVPNDETDA